MLQQFIEEKMWESDKLMKRHSAPKVTKKIKPAFRYNFTPVKLVNNLNQTTPGIDKDVEQQDLIFILENRGDWYRYSIAYCGDI